MPKAEPAPVSATPNSTYTNWDAFAKIGLVPVALECHAYKPVHLSDFSCHTRLKFDSETLKRHMVGEHGGAYLFALRSSDGKISPLWKDLAASGLEAQDFRCEVCDAVLRFHPSSIAQHNKPHRGKTRMAYRQLSDTYAKATGFFSMTLGAQRPEVEDSEEF